MKQPADYDQDTRIDAANTLVDALLGLCNSKAEKSALAVKILGHDPRTEK